MPRPNRLAFESRPNVTHTQVAVLPEEASEGPLAGVDWGALVFLVLVVGVIFLAIQVQIALAGHVEFATTKPSGCNISASRTEFPVGATVYWAAHFRDKIPAGSALLIEFTKDGQPAGTQGYKANGDDCLASSEASSPLSAGTYTVSIRGDGTLEASGTISVR